MSKKDNIFLDSFYRLRNTAKHFGQIIKIEVDHHFFDYLRFIEAQDITKVHVNHNASDDTISIYGIKFSRCEAIRVDKISQLKSELDKRDLEIKNLKHDNVMIAKWCIDKLATAKNLGEWSHSRDLKFAHVELSDWLLHQWRKRTKGSEG